MQSQLLLSLRSIIICSFGFAQLPIEDYVRLPLLVGERSRTNGSGAHLKGFVYILKCNNGQYYTGSTSNLERRLEQHKNGEGARFTKQHLPVELVYVEEFSRIDEAFYREKQIQGWSRKKKEALINSDFEELHKLSECKNDSHC